MLTWAATPWRPTTNSHGTDALVRSRRDGTTMTFTLDDDLLHRRIVAVRCGLLLALAVMLFGQEASDLPLSLGAQLPILATTATLALVLERHLRRTRR